MLPSAFRARIFAGLLIASLCLPTLASAQSGSTGSETGITGSETGMTGSETGSTGMTGSGGGGTGDQTFGPGDTDLGGGTLTLARAIFNGGTVSNGAIDASSEHEVSRGQVTAILAGSGSLSKITADTFIVASTSTYTGTTTVSDGTLQIGNGGTTGSIASTSIANNASLVFNRSDTLTYGGTISGSGSLTQAGTGTLILTSDNTYTGTTTVSAGTLQLGAGASGGLINGNITNDADVAFNRGGDYTFGGVISGTGNVIQNGSILRLSSAQTYTGTTTINGGIFVLPTGTDQGLSASTKVRVATGASVDLSNRALTVAGLTGNGTVYSFGGSSGHLTVATPNGESQVFSGVLGGSQADFALTKSGTGTLTLGGANNYTGDTTVSAGALLVNGSLGNTAVTVSSGANLGGSGTFGGLVSLSSGAHLAPGNSAGTLTFNSGLTLLSGSILDFELGTTSDRIVVAGGTLTGPASGTVTLNFSDAGGFAAGTYLLFDFSAGGVTTDSFDLADFTFGSTIAGFNYNLAFNGNTLALTASAIPEPSTVAVGLGAVALAAVIVRRRRRLLLR